MKTQKTAQQKLESWKGIFLKAGIIISMVFVFFAFEYKITERVIPELPSSPDLMLEDEMIDITRPKPPEPPPPPDSHEIITAPDDKITEEHIPVITIDVPNDHRQETLVPIDYPEEKPVDENKVFDRPEIMPEFPGGLQALYAYLGKVLKYPRMAQELNIHGTVIVGFVIEKDGSVSNVQILRGIGGGCDEEALKAIQNMPKWNPGKMGTHPVRVRYTVPVRFRLNK